MEKTHSKLAYVLAALLAFSLLNMGGLVACSKSGDVSTDPANEQQSDSDKTYEKLSAYIEEHTTELDETQSAAKAAELNEVPSNITGAPMINDSYQAAQIASVILGSMSLEELVDDMDLTVEVLTLPEGTQYLVSVKAKTDSSGETPIGGNRSVLLDANTCAAKFWFM